MRRLALGISLTALVTLVLELVLTRVFDVILMPNMAYMVITCAVFAFGLAGTVYRLSGPSADRGLPGRCSLWCGTVAASAVLLLPVLNLLPLDWATGYNLPSQAAAFLGNVHRARNCLLPRGPAADHRVQPPRAGDPDPLRLGPRRRGIGCVLLIPFLPAIGPGGILFLIAALALVASALFSPRRAWRIGALAAAAGAAAVPYVVPARVLEFREHIDKRGVEAAKRAGQIEFSRWHRSRRSTSSPSARSWGTTPNGTGQQRRLGRRVRRRAAAHQFFRFDGDLPGSGRTSIGARRGPCWRTSGSAGVLASHYLKRDTGAHVLIIGSAGGQETKAALAYGAAKVDAVEMVRHGGGARNRPLLEGDRRHLPRAPSATCTWTRAGASSGRADRRYDIIQIFSNYTTSSISNGERGDQPRVSAETERPSRSFPAPHPRRDPPDQPRSLPPDDRHGGARPGAGWAAPISGGTSSCSSGRTSGLPADAADQDGAVDRGGGGELQRFFTTDPRGRGAHTTWSRIRWTPRTAFCPTPSTRGGSPPAGGPHGVAGHAGDRRQSLLLLHTASGS